MEDVIYLTPFIPLSFEGEGEGFYKRGFASLEHSSRWSRDRERFRLTTIIFYYRAVSLFS